MMSRYGINCQHFLVGWSCGQQEPMSPEGIFSSTELLNIKYTYTHTLTYTTLISVVQAKKQQRSIHTIKDCPLSYSYKHLFGVVVRAFVHTITYSECLVLACV